MYGLVHLGLREMVVELAGEAGWARIERELGIGPAERLSLAVYDDELTLRILSAVTGLLQLDPEDCLALFGRHWVRFAARGSYASILNFTGQDLDVVAGTSTGEMRVEKPLGTETWREPGRERTWVQSTVRPVMYVTNPYAVLKFTGLAG